MIRLAVLPQRYALLSGRMKRDEIKQLGKAVFGKFQPGKLSPMRQAGKYSKDLFFRWEGPTWFLAIGLYTAWFLLVWFHWLIPWWLLLPLAAYVSALHFSLQHEAIHGWRSCPRWLRTAIVWPPIGLWLPFSIYYRSHRQHHRNADLTYPGKDTETLYHNRSDWQAYSPIWRGVLLANQTLVGRLIIGPMLRLRKLFLTDLGKFLHGDLSDSGIWFMHVVGCNLVLWYAVGVAGMPWWQYLLFFFYGGMVLSWLRPFLEHRWGTKPYERVAVIESNWFFGLLFLWNNLHIVHHRHPTMAWYEIPAYFRAHRDEMLASNGGFHYSGYWQLTKEHLLKPVFSPVHPNS